MHAHRTRRALVALAAAGLVAGLVTVPAGTAGASAVAAHHERISPVGAGFLGAGLTVAVFGIVAAVLVFLGLLTFGKGKRRVGKKEREGSNSSVCGFACLSEEVGG